MIHLNYYQCYVILIYFVLELSTEIYSTRRLLVSLIYTLHCLHGSIGDLHVYIPEMKCILLIAGIALISESHYMSVSNLLCFLSMISFNIENVPSTIGPVNTDKHASTTNVKCGYFPDFITIFHHKSSCTSTSFSSRAAGMSLSNCMVWMPDR